jgi:uncharacterized membrane protein YsdA (DUF1294 family)
LVGGNEARMTGPGAEFAGGVPLVLLCFYSSASVAAFVAYALDKSAAKNDRWRISERTLHLFGLLGGWPGALVAQKLLRHKTGKRSFQLVFRVTVVLNCGMLAWMLMLASPFSG